MGGRKLFLGAFCALMLGFANAEEVTIKDIKIEGIQRTDPGTVLNYLPLKKGDKLTDSSASAAVKALYGTGFFESVQLAEENGILKILLKERPAISAVEVVGAKSMSENDIKKALRQIGIAPALIYNPSLADKAVQELKRQYFNKGRYNVEVNANRVPQERNRIRLTFNIDEGKEAKIKDIRFVGNKAFADGDLQRQMSLTTPNLWSWFTKSDRYSRQTLSGDLETIRSFYLNHGYLEFAIESTQVSITPDRQNVFITINLHEGKPYKVSAINLEGKLLLPEEELQKLITLKAGDTFSREKLTQSAEKIANRLGDEGYAFANVNPIPKIDEAKGMVSFTFFVDPGKRAYVRRINIEGNTRTKDEVIRRELRQMESGWYSAAQVERSKTRLNRLGYFKEVNVETTPVPGTIDQVDVTFNVTEQSTGSVMAGAGFSTQEGLILSGSISENNLFGTGNRVALTANTGVINKVYSLTFTRPYITPNGISLSLQGFYHDFDSTENDWFWDLARYSYKNFGGLMHFGVPLSENDSFSFGGGYEQTNLGDLRDYTPSYIRDFYDKNGSDNSTIRLDFAWERDFRDHFFFPRRGWYSRVGTEFGVPGSDVEYFKGDVQGQYYIPFGDTMALMLNAGIAYGDGFSGDDLPFYKFYYAGGSNSLRGFENGTVGPHDEYEDAIGGDKRILMNAEYFFPMPFSLPLPGADSQQMRLSLFVDAGSVWMPGDSYDIGDLRYSTGLGFAWISPFGPIKVSVAYPIVQKDDDETQPFQFSFGTNF